MSPDGRSISNIYKISCLIFILSLLFYPAFAWAKREQLTYFPNTVYELNIYKIFGKNPGKTLMLIGGIQGNEPGGFLSADLYADMSLEKGNLIVVPRANFYSIILNQRGPNGDMNRKFTPGDASKSMEDKIVKILKDLISESDFLLNLHDGSGYYYPKYIDKWRNPNRFGQSIIADCSEYRIPGTDKVVRLKDMAERVIKEVNPYIKNDLYKFHFMDTKTAEKESDHKEQRRSATYYALTEHNIPAFGVETSKFLPTIDLKVRHHNLVINAFKKMFGIIPESPGMVFDKPLMQYLVVSINNQIPIVLKNAQTLKLAKGDSINVTHIEANYERGLSLDILGYGGLNDYRKDFRISRDTTMIVRKDNHKFAEIPIKVTRKSKPPVIKAGKEARDRPEGFIIEAKGERLYLKNGEILSLVKGERMKIIDVLPSSSSGQDITVNFKGFVGDRKNNTGEDRGYIINTGGDLMKRYSLKNRRETYEILATRGKKVLARMLVKLTAPQMHYTVLKVNNGKYLLLRQKESASFTREDEISLEEIKTNLSNEKGIGLHINGRKIKKGEKVRVGTLCPSSNSSPQRVEIKKGPLVLGHLFFSAN